MAVSIDNKRIVTIVSVDGTGKTTTAKRLLNFKNPLPSEPEEQSRGYTLFSKTFMTDVNDKELYVIDTPGSLNYINDVINCARVSNGAVYVLNATQSSFDHGLRLWWRINDYNVPTMIFVNMMDMVEADFDKVLDGIKNAFNISPLPVAIPVGNGAEFSGVINLMTQKLYTYKDDSGKAKEEDIPEKYADLVKKYRDKMIEAIVETDEKLMEKYLEGKEITNDELKTVLGHSVKARTAFPVYVGSADKNIGVDLLRDAIFYYLPTTTEFSPITFQDGTKPEAKNTAPFSAYVFKTRIDAYTGKTNYIKILSGTLSKATKASIVDVDRALKVSKISKPYPEGLKAVDEAYAGDIVVLDKCDDIKTGFSLIDSSLGKKPIAASPEPKRVLTYAVDMSDKGMEEKVADAIKKIREEDPSITYLRVPETREFVISALGQLQLDVVNEMLKNRYKLQISMRPPRIQYRETVKKSVRVQGKHKKQSGGHGQYGDCWIKMEPLPRNKGFEFVDAIVGGVIPRNFIPSVEKGIVKTMDRGFVGGYPVIDVRVTLDDGSYHDVDSSDMAFQIAGSMAFKNAIEEANSVLLEPIMDVTINVPDRFVGAITNDLSGRRGRISGMDSSTEGSVVKARVPLSELLTYAPELHSMTQGLGLFEMKFSTYEEVPMQNVAKIIADTKKWKEEEKQEL
ncbi:MAG: elongation factor G [Pseudomonadota bacterium]